MVTKIRSLPTVTDKPVRSKKGKVNLAIEKSDSEDVDEEDDDEEMDEL